MNLKNILNNNDTEVLLKKTPEGGTFLSVRDGEGNSRVKIKGWISLQDLLLLLGEASSTKAPLPESPAPVEPKVFNTLEEDPDVRELFGSLLEDSDTPSEPLPDRTLFSETALDLILQGEAEAPWEIQDEDGNYLFGSSLPGEIRKWFRSRFARKSPLNLIFCGQEIRIVPRLTRSDLDILIRESLIGGNPLRARALGNTSSLVSRKPWEIRKWFSPRFNAVNPYFVVVNDHEYLLWEKHPPYDPNLLY